MATASFEVATYEYYDWSSTKTGKTTLILKGVGGEVRSVGFVEDPGRGPSSRVSGRSELLRVLLPPQAA
jgi:hypothetical protein